MRVGYYQFKPQFGKVAKNVQKVISVLKTVSADLVVLPELPFTGYYFTDRAETQALAEDPASSSHISSLISLCRERDFYLVTGFAEKKADKIFNSALLIGPEGVVHTYRKLHLFNEEKFLFDAGDTPLQINEVRGAKIGLMICFDWVFPEVTRTLALLGADLICHPANLVLSYCQQTMLSRCIENGIFAVTCNRFGADKRPQGKLKFIGKSQIVAPKGVLLHQSHSQIDDLFLIDINPELARDKHLTPHNSLFTDRRPEFYTPLCKNQF